MRLSDYVSNPSKMPGLAFGINQDLCKTGAKLAKVENSICSKCYAKRGNYRWNNVKAAQQRRLNNWLNDRQEWIKTMTSVIAKQEYFRWFDSGDLQSLDMLKDIVEVAKATPNTMHWLQTQERKIVKRYIKDNDVPDNLIIRVSAVHIDQAIVQSPTGYASTVSKAESLGCAFMCPSKHNGNKCGDCRACWDKSISLVAYIYH